MFKENHNNIEEIIENFESISLKEIDSLELLNRQDTKYIFNFKDLPEILFQLKNDYNILDINENRIFNYDNLYFDTAHLKFYRQHHNGKMDRIKVRFRHYEEIDKYFFELKFKTNKDDTLKDRIKTDSFEEHLINGESEIIRKWSDIDPDKLQPKVKIKYRRITLAGKNNQEKVTIDTDLTADNGEKNIKFDNLVIAELKQKRSTAESVFYNLMHSLGIRPMSLSKYTLGIMMTYDNIKYNRFKPKLLQLKKITQETNGKFDIWDGNI